VRDRTDGIGVDVALECAGNEAALATCIAAARARGTVAQIGLHVRPAAIDAMTLAEREITLVGTWAYPVQDWARITAQVASGRLPVERVVTARVELDDVVSDGFDVLVDPQGDQIKVLVSADGGRNGTA
jgi:(R,R)-butanediol dehydrogenase / meso-butanediol dehydrogenase / diacetyl reductase